MARIRETIVLMSFISDAWGWYHDHREDLTPLLAPLGSIVVGLGTIIVGGLVALAALRQARTSTRQAQIATQVAEAANSQAATASKRHDEQTKADQQRRITESFSRAIEQLASEEIEIRVGGIYTLERIAHDSLDDYWTVMETLTTFVRERAKWKEPSSPLAEIMSRYDDADSPAHPPEPAADIAAVLAVIGRRSKAGLD